MWPNEVLYGFKLRSSIRPLAQGLALQDTKSFSMRRSTRCYIAKDYNEKHKKL